MKPLNIQYKFTLEDKNIEVFDLEMNLEDISISGHLSDNNPHWIDLEFHKCPNCPLKEADHPHCPLAVSLVDIVEKFEKILSYNKVFLEVTMGKKVISQETTAQRGISSLMGILIATSGCPHTAFLKPMARFHKPFADTEDTIYRSTSMYLLAQYFCKKEGKDFDFNMGGLAKLYRQIDIVNDSIADRIRAASEADSTVNAIVLLDLFAKTLPMVIDESLDEIRYLFKPFLETKDRE